MTTTIVEHNRYIRKAALFKANGHLGAKFQRNLPEDSAVLSAIQCAWMTTKTGRTRSQKEMERLYINLARNLRRQLLEQLAKPQGGMTQGTLFE